jgi:hypothetical protein
MGTIFKARSGSIPAVWRAEPAGRQVSISGHYDGALSVGNKEIARAAYGGPLAGFVRAQRLSVEAR